MRDFKIIIALILLSLTGKAQPYADLLYFNTQIVNTAFNDSFPNKNNTINYALNLTVPIKLDSQNMIIIRWFGETLKTHTTIKSGEQVPFYNVKANNDIEYNNTFYASILPVGFQHETKSKKWKLLLLAMPKIAGTTAEPVTKYNFQPGVYSMATRKINDHLSIKGGLFYNREFFGNFFVPIVSVDWKVNSRFQMYGTFPTFYKAEYQLVRKKVCTGLAYRSYTRSFLLPGAEHNYVRIDDMSIKLFLDFYIKKKIYLFAEMGQMINYGLRDFTFNTKDEIKNSVLYRKDKSNLFINAGIAYRIRFDFND